MRCGLGRHAVHTTLVGDSQHCLQTASRAPRGHFVFPQIYRKQKRCRDSSMLTIDSAMQRESGAALHNVTYPSCASLFLLCAVTGKRENQLSLLAVRFVHFPPCCSSILLLLSGMCLCFLGVICRVFSFCCDHGCGKSGSCTKITMNVGRYEIRLPVRYFEVLVTSIAKLAVNTIQSHVWSTARSSTSCIVACVCSTLVPCTLYCLLYCRRIGGDTNQPTRPTADPAGIPRAT